ncbi:MAG: GyrI-like domain-containing protein [Dactylosporangium sp.]|nr:GyrI-like domain-containing protein [Dactylosporangium sp.]NNJ61498.1 GyrI-like domain-containing protein [Dactylosporangium sp.]
MNDLTVRIERLAPMRMASASVVADDAERQAFDRLRAWAEPRGLFDVPGRRVFGFDNCQPSPNHRYTCMVPVGGDVRGDDDIGIVDLPGGAYAVATVRGADNVHPAWARLSAWPAASGYRPAHRQALEEIVSPTDGHPDDLTLDLYLPVE